MKKTDRHEIIIVGAGPGGLSFAIEAQKTCRDILIIDPDPEKEKVCGCGISDRAVHEFGIPSSIILRRYEHVFTYAPNGKRFTNWDRGGIYGSLHRSDLQKWLLSKINPDRVKILKGTVISVERTPTHKGRTTDGIVMTRSGQTFSCKYLVGADGVNSVVRRDTVRPIPSSQRSTCIVRYYKMKEKDIDALVGNAMHVWFPDKKYIPQGYAWVTPMKDQLNVGIGTRSKYANGLRKKFDDFIFNELSHLKFGEEAPYTERGGCIPTIQDTWFCDLPFADRKWCLIGDAAGHVHVTSGEGIAFAMWDGRQAARCMVNSNGFRRYAQAWNIKYGIALREQVERVRHITKEWENSMLNLGVHDESVARFIYRRTDLQKFGLQDLLPLARIWSYHQWRRILGT